MASFTLVSLFAVVVTFILCVANVPIVGLAVRVNVLLSVVVILERIFTQVTKLSKEICTEPEQVVSSEFVVIEVLSIVILNVMITGVLADIPVDASAGEVEVTDGSKEDGVVVVEVGEVVAFGEVEEKLPLRIAVIVPTKPGLGLLTSKGERFAFKQFNKINGNTNVIK